ncbi:sigma 54-interacting transcriptional regulator [Natranaerobius thermophilus]|uniref:HTH-type transcriptional regulatory protein TyrR n=1 Tax=Natranaerobius thermophilus (strain ATCC BAA-1301 / DSM 18059 / JW/NM-WN-LF) TaxID=457570 RepID=B2A3R3_NATTJ|nr:sigma 54-interacting transcriptional regulator [Natranaerobius thermophilus]ACB83689.1 PAS modulated sigma54 specific transcriptional regulator, Fis family [Natranaerobius thermophilus JW/NM-WN-LF]
MSFFRYQVQTVDRVGMVLDVLRVVYLKNINITAMEVAPQLIYLKLDFAPAMKGALESAVKEIPGVRGIDEISLLPQEEKEQKLRGILDTIGEGIIALDKSGIITMINPSAEKILNLSENIEGRDIRDILSAELPILKTLSAGEDYDNKEIFVTLPGGKSHYLTSGRPIKNDDGNTVGAVAAIKDINEVRKLVHRITHPTMLSFDDIIAESSIMNETISFAKKIAHGDSTVLLTGESGTGKELFARAIHMESPRKDCPFVPLNCAAIPETLMESELFGYEEGAFTGAKKGGKHGLFELANKGTVFLDEIGNLNPQLQVKLLRVLQEREVRRIGGKEEISVDIRVITATNHNLEKLVNEGYFREDLYYRLNVIPIKLPPLRNRKEDIIPLANHILGQMRTNHGGQYQLSPKSRELLKTYSWPGNVRELENIIERAVNLANDNIIEGEHLFFGQEDGFSNYEGEMENWEQNQQYQNGQSEAEISVNYKDKDFSQILQSVEKQILQKVLSEHASARKAAKQLGVSHTTILNKIKKYGLQINQESN